MGRGIETAMLNYIKDEYIERRSFDRLRAIFIPTAKNKPAMAFYSDHGFSLTQGEEGAECHYTLLPDDSILMGCHWIEVKKQKEP
jgi:predicted enzyme involved in methoxymalonyl-ACP biosynthesis